MSYGFGRLCGRWSEGGPADRPSEGRIGFGIGCVSHYIPLQMSFSLLVWCRQIARVICSPRHLSPHIANGTQIRHYETISIWELGSKQGNRGRLANVVSFSADNGLTAAVAREGLHGSRGARRGGMSAVQVLLAGSNIPALAQSETTVRVLRPVSYSEHG